MGHHKASSAPDAGGLNARIAKLKAEFTDGLRARLDAIRGRWEGYRDRVDDPEELRELRRLVHGLIGSSASFDFVDISAKASGLRDALRALPESDALATEVRRVDIAINALADEIARVVDHAPDALHAGVSGVRVDPHRVQLLAGDDLATDDLLRALGRAGYSAQRLVRFTDVHDRATDPVPGVVILDMRLLDGQPDLHEALAGARGHRATPVPVILVGDTGAMDERLAAVRAGADGFLPRPLDIPCLMRQITVLSDETRVAGKRVLVLDGDADQRKLTQTVLLEYGFEVRGQGDGANILQVLDHFKPDVLVTDQYMPTVSGKELATVIRQFPQWQNLPILFFSSEADARAQLEALRSGADAFLPKPVNPDTLAETLRVHLLRAHRRGLALAASAVSAPEPANPHSALLSWLEEAQGGAILFLELSAADLGLTLGVREQRVERLQKLAAQRFGTREPLRYGGGLVQVLPDIPESRQLPAARTLRELAHDAGLQALAVGVVAIPPGPVDDQVLASLSAAVQAARDGDGIFAGQPDQGADDLSATDSELADASETLSTAELRLLLQPMINLKGWPLEYHEVLARLHTAESPEGMPPTRFGEHMGDTTPARDLDRQVLDKALALFAREPDRQASAHVLVKLSEASLHDPELPLWVLESLKAHQLSGPVLCLSADASVLEACSDAVMETLVRLQSFGCSWCVEGFPGRSDGERLLNRLKPRLVKLQHGLLHGVRENIERRDRLARLTTMIRAADAHVVAAFVEDAETLSVLYQCGADYAQGYFIQPPVRAAEYAFDNPQA